MQGGSAFHYLEFGGDTSVLSLGVSSTEMVQRFQREAPQRPKTLTANSAKAPICFLGILDSYTVSASAR